MTRVDRRVTNLPDELAFDLLVAANLMGLPRLVQISEIALQPVLSLSPALCLLSSSRLQLIEGGNAVPFYLAARHHQAEQLAQVCAYVMASDYPTAEKDPQWAEVDEETRRSCVFLSPLSGFFHAPSHPLSFYLHPFLMFDPHD